MQFIRKRGFDLKKKNENAQIDELLSQAEVSIRRNRVILFITIALIELVLVGLSMALKWFSISEFIINIVNNIIGILPPMLLFDYFYEKISSDASSIETSKKITATMMGQPETLKLFNIEDRKKFLKSTVNSVISDPDLTDMILDNVNRYVIDPSTLNIRIRKEFNYSIELDQDLPKDYEKILGDTNLASEEYYLVQEILNYTAKQFKPETEDDISIVNVGFMFDNKGLDEILRNELFVESEVAGDVKGLFIFRENLDLSNADVCKLITYLKEKPEETINRFSSMSRLSLRLNGKLIELSDVIITDTGIICKYKLEEKISSDYYSVRVIFSMPKRWGSVIEVALVEPTYAPKITLSYPRDKMSIDMYSFLNKSDNTSLEEAHEQLNGVFDVALNEWVYPISGMIFKIEKKGE